MKKEKQPTDLNKRAKNIVDMATGDSSHKFAVGDRVTSTEVEPNDFGGVYQQKQMEIREITGNKAKCIYFSEKQFNSKTEYHTVSLSSLTYINSEPLKPASSLEDPFFKRVFKKGGV